MIVQPKPSLARPYQIRAIERMAVMDRVLQADPQGAGKTLMVLGTLNQKALFDEMRVLIVCPASIKFVWETEICKWVIPPSRIEIISGIKAKKGCVTTHEGLEPDQDVETFPIDFTIVNYDIVFQPAVRKKLMADRWDYIIFDEAHSLKTRDSRRSKVCLGTDGKTIPLIRNATHIIAITGTPLNNHVIDLYPLATTLAPEEFDMDYERFAWTYCAPRETDYGWDYTGASNLDELNAKLRRSCMIRRKKEVILPELPAKQISTTFLDCASSLIRAEENALKANGAFDLKNKFRGVTDDEEGVLLNAMATCRREMGEEKLKVAIPLILEWLGSCKDKLVIMAYHTDVIKGLSSALTKKKISNVVLMGATSAANGKKAVMSFQEDPTVRVFIGNIQAAGTGITLTAASTMFFLEIDWNPSTMMQAMDRIHRIGQTRKVQIQMLCFKNSLEAAIAKSLERKAQRIEVAIDQGSDVQAHQDMTPDPRTEGHMIEWGKWDKSKPWA